MGHGSTEVPCRVPCRRRLENQSLPGGLGLVPILGLIPTHSPPKPQTRAQGSVWKVLPRSIQILLKKEDADTGFWERLLKDKQLEKTNVKVRVVWAVSCVCVAVVVVGGWTLRC